MIFDMTRRSSGGGSGPSASDAILTVTVPTGSTVTATKGGVTLTPTMWVQAADNTLDCALFVIQPSLFDSQNAWTVSATLGTDTASDTLTINSNSQYDLTLEYGTILFDNGFIMAELGDFVGVSRTSITNNLITAINNNYNGNYFRFTSGVAFSSYGTILHILITQTEIYSASMPTKIGVFNSRITDSPYEDLVRKAVAVCDYTVTDGVERDVTVDISNLSPNTTYYLSGIAIASFTISRIWITQ